MLSGDSVGTIGDTFAELEERGIAEFTGEGLQGLPYRTVDIRYRGQGHELNVPCSRESPQDSVEAFHRLHQQRYGISDSQRAVEIVNLRLRMVAPGEQWSPPRRDCVPGDGAAACYAERQIFFDAGFVRTPLYRRDSLVPGDMVHGPAMITEYTAATVLPPDGVAAVDGFGNLVITFPEEGSA
jgi:N-methylhydantoinase A